MQNDHTSTKRTRGTVAVATMARSTVAIVRKSRARTIPEQIADHVGTCILKGEYKGGEHIPEQELAARFDVSHGPVREAIRELGKRGLVEHLPRRGAYAIEVTLDAIADMFNIRAALLGLAANNLALRFDAKDDWAKVSLRSAAVYELSNKNTVDPVEFTFAVARAGSAIWRSCGNGLLMKMMQEQDDGSLWGLMWREYSLDFRNIDRRRAAANSWVAAAKAISSGNGSKAEQIVKNAIYESRDEGLQTLRKVRGLKVDISKYIKV